ncbi:hypothetical protein DL767_005103 [Monosporascus sp. MG133]|nr:hypothetical protein DL767_005103 [Monosporascus sp. MG133]
MPISPRVWLPTMITIVAFVALLAVVMWYREYRKKQHRHRQRALEEKSRRNTALASIYGSSQNVQSYAASARCKDISQREGKTENVRLTRPNANVEAEIASVSSTTSPSKRLHDAYQQTANNNYTRTVLSVQAEGFGLGIISIVADDDEEDGSTVSTARAVPISPVNSATQLNKPRLFEILRPSQVTADTQAGTLEKAKESSFEDISHALKN